MYVTEEADPQQSQGFDDLLDPNTGEVGEEETDRIDDVADALDMLAKLHASQLKDSGPRSLQELDTIIDDRVENMKIRPQWVDLLLRLRIKELVQKR